MASSISSQSPRSRLSGLLMLIAMLPMVVLPPYAIAGPTGGQVVAGQVNINVGGAGQLNIDQSSAAAIINWQDFSIGAGERVNINQPNAHAALLNRVLGANPSELLGQLNANGRVYLVNPNGVLVGKDARIDAGSFFATTAQIGDAAFMAGGDLQFSDGTNASIVNLGVIKASDGDAVLVAHRVVNAGEVHAPQGTAALGAATEFVYSPLGDTTVRIIAGAESADATGIGVDNAGLVTAAEARLEAANGNLYELAINQTGLVRATGVERRAGRVLLTSAGGRVAHTGEIAAHNADGSGGEVRLGGGFHGADVTIANADVAFVGDDAVINVSANTANADAGSAVVWADGATYFGGLIEGRGGEAGGDGAEVEVSGLRKLDFRGLVDVSAPVGQAGSLLLDPVSLEIVAAGTETNPITLGDAFTFGKNNGIETSTLLVSTLETQLALGNVKLDTSVIGPATGEINYGNPAPANPVEYADGSITVSSPITWTSGHRLTFNSGNSIYVNAGIHAGTGDITFGLGPKQDGFSDAHYTMPALASELVVAGAAGITANSILINKAPITDPGNSFANEGPIGRIAISGALDVGTVEISSPTDALSQYGGIAGEVTLDNAANKIGVLRGSDGKLIQGDITVVDSADGLTIEGEFYAGKGAGISIATTGDLTLAAGAKLSTGIIYGTEQVPPYSDIYLAARGGSFINQAGATAINAEGTGRFLIYSATPNTITKGGLVGDPVYNKTFDGNAPTSITQTGDRFLYELAPAITVTADTKSREYGDANPAFTYTITGLLAGDTAGNVYTGTPTVATAFTTSGQGGTHTGGITVSQTGLTLSDYDYGFTGVAADLTITPAALTVTPNAGTRGYGDADPALTGAFTGFKNGEGVGDLTTAPTYTPSSAITSPVGTYNITASGAVSPNYTFTYQPGTNLFSITPASLTITADAATRVYGAADPSFTATFTGLKNSDTSSLFPGLAFATPDSTVSSNVGTSYLIRPSGASNVNYTVSFADGTLSVTRAPLTITAQNASINLGGTVPDPTTYSATYTGLTGGDVASHYSGLLAFTNAATNSGTAGTFAIIPSGVVDPNYDITFTNGVLSIGTGLLTVTADDLSRIYGASNPAFTSSIAGFVGTDTSSILTSPVTFSTLAVVGSPVGTYAIVPGGATAPNYSFSFVNGTLTIDPTALTITALDAARLYGAADPTFSANMTGLVAGDTSADITGLTFATNATINSAVSSSNYIRPAGATNSNYTINFTDGALTINPAGLTLTANDATREYGATDPTFGSTMSGFVAGDDSSAINVGGLNYSVNATIGSPVGSSYTITPSGANSSNYVLTYAGGTLTITPASLLITPNSVSRIYGDTDPAFSSAFTGLRAGDTATAITGLGFSTAALNADVGTYALTASGASNSNYTISYATGQLAVTPRSVTVAAPSLTRTYGEPTPTLNSTITGLASFDNASVLGSLTLTTTGRDQFANAGAHAITPSGASSSNYTISYQPGTLTIDPRAATITALDTSREYGEINPTFSTSQTGFFASDFNPSGVSISTSATQYSNVGAYLITPTAYSDANYAVTFVNGELTITPAELTVTAVSASRIYGDANPTFAYTFTGFKGTDTDAVMSGGSVQVAADQSASVGEYAVTFSGATATNYNVVTDGGTLTILPRSITIEAGAATRYYGDANPTFTISNPNTNLLPALDPIDQVVSLGTGATATSFAGSYAIDVSLLNSNYALTASSGTLTVNRLPLDILIDSAERIYGENNSAFTYRSVGMALPAGTDLSDQIIPGTQVATNADSDVGFYTIINQGYIDSRRFELVSLQPGVLTVQARPVTVVIDNLSQSYDAGTNLAGVKDFSDLVFTGSLEGARPGDTLAGVFRDFTYRVFGDEGTSAEVTRPDYTNAVTVPAAGDIRHGFLPNLQKSPTETQVLNFKPSEGFFIGSSREAGIAPDEGYLYTNPNYVVTAVVPGRLSMRIPFNFNEEVTRIKLPHKEPIVVRSQQDYRKNFGIYFDDNPSLGPGLVRDHLIALFDDPDLVLGSQPLLLEIFGSSVDGPEDIDPAMIRAWMSDISSNLAKRQLLSGVFANYVMDLHGKNPASYSVGEQQLISALNAEMREQRVIMATAVTAKREAWYQEKAKTSNLADTFDGMIPYEKFTSEFMEESLQINAANVAAAVGGSAAGVAAASAAGVAASQAVAVIMPFAAQAALKAGATAAAAATAGAGKAALGPFAAIVIVVEVSIVRGIQLVENAKAKKDFEAFLEPGNHTSLAGMNLEPEDDSIGSVMDRLVLMNALTNMLNGNL